MLKYLTASRVTEPVHVLAQCSQTLKLNTVDTLADPPDHATLGGSDERTERACLKVEVVSTLLSRSLRLGIRTLLSTGLRVAT